MTRKEESQGCRKGIDQRKLRSDATKDWAVQHIIQPPRESLASACRVQAGMTEKTGVISGLGKCVKVS